MIKKDIKRSTAACIIMAVIFIGFIALFTLGTMFSEDRKFSEMENRLLAQKPALSFSSIFVKKGEKTYMDKLEEYMSDQIFMKDYMMSVKTECDYFSGKTYQNGLYFSKGGFLLQKYSENTPMIDKNVSCINDFASNVSVPVDFILAPNSICVNADRLPAGALTDDQRKTIERVRGSLAPNVKLYDPYDLLTDLQTNQNINTYYKTDHHWTAGAARAVCDGWLQSIGMEATDADYTLNKVSDFYGTFYSKAPAHFIQPDEFSYYTNNSGQYEVFYQAENRYVYSMIDDSFLKKKDKYASFFGGNFAQMKIRRTNDPEGDKKPKILVIKDSYANSLIPFLADRFSEVYVVDLRYYHTGLVSDIVKENGINRVLLCYNVDFLNEDQNFIWLG